MKSLYGAPSLGISVSAYETERIRKNGEAYSRQLMEEVLLAMTETELAMQKSWQSGKGAKTEYDYEAFHEENRVFAAGNRIHVLRHFRYDCHETHTHDFFEIICCCHGTGRLFLSDAAAGTPLCRGTVCILAPGMPHRLEAAEEDAIVLKLLLRRTDFDVIYNHFLECDSALNVFFRHIFRDRNEGGGWLLFETQGKPEIEEILFRMRYVEVRSAATDSVMKEALLMELFCHLISGGIRDIHAPDKAVGILLYIREHFRTVTLKELSERFFFTEDYISRLIRESTGMNYTVFIQSLRIHHARRLLQTTTIPISAVAAESGFGCKEFFCKKFRESTGMTPRAYRNRTEQTSEEQGIMLFRP